MLKNLEIFAIVLCAQSNSLWLFSALVLPLYLKILISLLIFFPNSCEIPTSSSQPTNPQNLPTLQMTDYFIRIPYPATSDPRDQVVFAGGEIRSGWYAAEPHHSLLLLLSIIAVFWLSLSSLCGLSLQSTCLTHSQTLPQSCVRLSSTSSCRPPPRDPVLWSCPPLSRPPLAV